MAPVHVRVRHDDDAVVAKLRDVEIVLSYPATQSGDERAHLRRGEHLVEARLLDVEDLALERQDGLSAPVAALFGRATGGITLDNEDLGERGVFFLAIG